jgi:phosphoribosylaminoimidazole (AIR) synthetase
VRHVLLERAGWTLDRDVEELGRTLGEELLEPTRLYAQPCLTLARARRVNAFSHVTGGGLAANLERVLPAGVAVTLDRSTWAPAPSSTWWPPSARSSAATSSARSTWAWAWWRSRRPSTPTR